MQLLAGTMVRHGGNANVGAVEKNFAVTFYMDRISITIDLFFPVSLVSLYLVLELGW
jgi:hypothetical protein